MSSDSEHEREEENSSSESGSWSGKNPILPFKHNQDEASDHAEDEAVLILHDEKTPSKKVVGRKTGSGIFKIRSPSVGRKLSSKASQECMTFSVHCLCDRL